MITLAHNLFGHSLFEAGFSLGGKTAGHFLGILKHIQRIRFLGHGAIPKSVTSVFPSLVSRRFSGLIYGVPPCARGRTEESKVR
jgi:hypothetical protein